MGAPTFTGKMRPKRGTSNARSGPIPPSSEALFTSRFRPPSVRAASTRRARTEASVMSPSIGTTRPAGPDRGDRFGNGAKRAGLPGAKHEIVAAFTQNARDDFAETTARAGHDCDGIRFNHWCHLFGSQFRSCPSVDLQVHLKSRPEMRDTGAGWQTGVPAAGTAHGSPDDWRDGEALRRGDVSASVLRGTTPDPRGADRCRPPPVSPRGHPPRRVYRVRATNRLVARGDSRGALEVAQESRAGAPRLGEALGQLDASEFRSASPSSSA